MDASVCESLAVLAHLQLANGKYEQGLSLLEALYAITPTDANVGCLLGLARLRSGDAFGALRVLDECLGRPLDPGQRRAAAMLRAQALWQCGSASEATKWYQTEVASQA